MRCSIAGVSYDVDPCPECGQAALREREDGTVYGTCPCADRPFPSAHVRVGGCTCSQDDRYGQCPCLGTGRVLADTPEGPRMWPCPASMGGGVTPLYEPTPENARRLLAEYRAAGGQWGDDSEVVALSREGSDW